jgi:hypothetical protein
MPDLERCTVYEGKIYCWNKATRKIAVIDVKDVDFKDCPDCVIQAIVEYKREIKDEKCCAK